MRGLHLTADLHGCAGGSVLATDAAALRARCLAAVQASGLVAVGELFHRFMPTGPHGDRDSRVGPDKAEGNDSNAAAAAPIGVTGVVLLAESHLAVHTWPELAAVTLDVYVCNVGRDNTERAHALIDHLIETFAPTQVERHRLERGTPRPAGTQPAGPRA